jgi:hypothetical protein
MITIPSSVTTALASTHYRVALLADLPGTGMSVTDNHKPITFGGTTYSATDGLLLKTSDVSRTTAIEVNSYTLTFSGADKSAYTQYYDNTHVGKSATLYLAFLDDDYALLDSGSVVEMYTGIIDTWALSETGTTSDFSIKMTNHWSTFEIINGRFTNSSSQQEVYDGDTIFEYSTQDKLPLKWGI